MAAATEEKRDVLTRLDSLLARGQEVESGPNSVTSSTSTCSSAPSSILKTSKGISVKKKISFPEDNLQEVIGKICTCLKKIGLVHFKKQPVPDRVTASQKI